MIWMHKANTNGFKWQPSYYEAIRDLPDAERLKMYDAISDYGFGNVIEDLPPLLNGYFLLMKPILEKSVEYYTAQQGNGKKGGRPPKKTKQNPNKTQKNPAVNRDSDSDSDSEIESDSIAKGTDKPRKKSFIPPTVEEVRAYISEKGYTNVDAEEFVYHYDARGWMMGKTKMTRWKSAVSQWARNNKGNGKQTVYNYDVSGVDSL